MADAAVTFPGGKEVTFTGCLSFLGENLIVGCSG